MRVCQCLNCKLHCSNPISYKQVPSAGCVLAVLPKVPARNFLQLKRVPARLLGEAFGVSLEKLCATRWRKHVRPRKRRIERYGETASQPFLETPLLKVMKLSHRAFHNKAKVPKASFVEAWLEVFRLERPKGAGGVLPGLTVFNMFQD